jgi:Ala-tRNA(Pro) deacylase
MSILKRLKDYLDREKVPYAVLAHSETFTAPELAQALHVPGKELAKVVMVKTDERFVMMVLSANRKVDLKRLKELFRTSHVRLATEAEFKELFPDCELGAMPPFGNLYGLEVYVDQSLTTDEEIVFQAGTRHEAAKLRYQDFAGLVRPRVAVFHVATTGLKTDP